MIKWDSGVTAAILFLAVLVIMLWPDIVSCLMETLR